MEITSKTWEKSLSLEKRGYQNAPDAAWQQSTATAPSVKRHCCCAQKVCCLLRGSQSDAGQRDNVRMTDTAHTPTKNQDFRADPAFEATRALLRAAQRIAVMSGAGMSAESGVPTFRDAQTGLWSNCRPEDLADERAYRQRPGWVWDWYMYRREQLKTVKPNAGHIALAEFQQRHPQRLTLMTQNVDRLHQAAGSTGVLELHGNLVDDRWLDPCPKTPACPAGRAPCANGKSPLCNEGTFPRCTGGFKRLEGVLSRPEGVVTKDSGLLHLHRHLGEFDSLFYGTYVAILRTQAIENLKHRRDEFIHQSRQYQVCQPCYRDHPSRIF